MDDTTLHDAARRSLDAGRALPAWCYTSADFFRAEIEHIHRRNWIFAGRTDELKAPGDYRTIDTVGGPVILLRDGDGAQRAFANCCRHRGSLLLTGTGNAQSIVCPYHAWSYRFDGALLAAPGMARTPGFDKAAHALAAVRMETWQGFMFINFDRAAPPLLEHLGDLPEILGSYRFGDMVCTWRAEIACRCNWKLLVENSLEAYHTGSVHAATVGAQREEIIPTRGDWVCLQVLSERSVAVLTDQPPFPPIDASCTKTHSAAAMKCNGWSPGYRAAPSAFPSSQALTLPCSPWMPWPTPPTAAAHLPMSADSVAPRALPRFPATW